MYWQGSMLVAVKTKEHLISWSFYSTFGHFFGGYAIQRAMPQFFIVKLCSFRLLVWYRNIFLTQASLNNSMFYLSLMLNYFFSNGLACMDKKRPKMLKYQSSEMHFMKLWLEMPFHLLQLKSMGWTSLWNQLQPWFWHLINVSTMSSCCHHWLLIMVNCSLKFTPHMTWFSHLHQPSHPQHIPFSPPWNVLGNTYSTGLHMCLIASVTMQMSNPFGKHGTREPTSRMLDISWPCSWLMQGGGI